jgi:hypothetical protein
MRGFSASLAAFKAGNISEAFQIAFASVVLQAKQTANEIYRNLVAVFEASADFLKTVFGPGSASFIIVKEAFSLLGNQLSLAIGSGLKPIVEAIPGIGSGMAESISAGMRVVENEINNSTNRINNLIEDGELAGDLARAGKAFPESFKAAYDSTQPLLAVEADMAKVDEMSRKYATDAGARAAELVFAEVDAAEQRRKSEQEKITALNEVAAKKQNEFNLETQINEARAAGNTEEVKRLEGIKIYNKTLEDALKNNIGIEAATRAATAAQNAHMAAAKDSKKELMEIKNVGDLIAKIDAAQPMRTFTEKSKDARKDLQDLKDFIGGDFSKMSVPDIAKKLGIDTTKKSAKELLDEIQAKMDEIKKKPLQIDIDKKATKEQLTEISKDIGKMDANTKVGLDAAPALADVQSKIAALGNSPATVTLDASSSIGQIRSDFKTALEVDLKAAGAGASNPTLDAIKTAVEMIKSLVEKIEPKLPTHALGA